MTHPPILDPAQRAFVATARTRDARDDRRRTVAATRPDLLRARRRRVRRAVHAARREAEARRRPARPRARPRRARAARGHAPRPPLGRGLDAARLGAALRHGERAGARREVEEHAAAIVPLRAKYPQYARAGDRRAPDAPDRDRPRDGVGRPRGPCRTRAGSSSTSSRNAQQRLGEPLGRSRLGMWATSGSSISRAFGARSASSRAATAVVPDSSSSPTITRTGTHSSPSRPAAGGSSTTVSPYGFSCDVGLVGSSGGRARAAGSGARPAGCPTPSTQSWTSMLGHRRPVLRLLERLALRERGLLLGVLSQSVPEIPPHTWTMPETRSGYSSAVSSDDRPRPRAPDEHRLARAPPRPSRRSGRRGSRTGRARPPPGRSPRRSYRTTRCRADQRVPLRVPLAGVRDPGVGQHDAGALARPLGPQPPPSTRT